MRHPACESLFCPRRTNPTQEVTRHGNKTRNVWRDASHRLRLHASIPIDPRDFPVLSATLWRKVKAGTFPKPVKLGPRITAWRVEDIREMLQRGA